MFLVLIGHVGRATDHTSRGSFDYTGGSGFAAAFAASWLLGPGAGLVAQVGDDVGVGELERLGLDLEGIARLDGPSARFEIDQLADGTFTFASDLGVAAEPRFDLFPVGYLRARHIHLGTAPPDQQREWLKFLRDKGYHGRVSVDMFEPFVHADPDACRRLCELTSLVFLNEAEYQALYGGIARPRMPTIVKHGADGAELLGAPPLGYGPVPLVTAPAVAEVDPVGAGEILAAVFLSLRLRGLDDAAALERAVKTASVSVTEFGVAGDAVQQELARLRDELEAGPRR